MFTSSPRRQHISTFRFGATPEEWAQFDLVLGLTEDLLPVVSNPNAAISAASKMAALGKTPSVYNRGGNAVGLSGWTSRVTSPDLVLSWSSQPDYGICLQTRRVRAIDIDIEDPAEASDIEAAILEVLGLPLPARVRENSGKLLLALALPGELSKRVIRTEGGIIEFLATGQQFVAAGTHPSGVRYRWRDGLPSVIPEITLSQFEALWSRLQERFELEPSPNSPPSVKLAKLTEAAKNDPVASAIVERSLALSTERDGRLHIECPFAAEHTGESTESATTYWPAHTGGYERGHFKCLHAHCEGRRDEEFLLALGLAPDPRDDFFPVDPPVSVADLATNVPNLGTIVPKLGTLSTALHNPGTPSRFLFVPAQDFSAGGPPGWIVKGVLPKADLAVIYGEPGSGKSFFALDLAGAIAQGLPWRHKRTRGGRVGYIAAEGAGGFRNRLGAYSQHHGVPLTNLDLVVLASCPSMMEAKDVIDLGNSMRACGPLSVLIVDTLAQVSAGANENSGEDMGRIVGHCRTLHTVTGALILLVHHSGKDASRGARGWSGLKGAIDAEIEVTRDGVNRTALVSKLKDGEDGERFGFKLRVVQIGTDEEGDPISSCVLEHGAVVPQGSSRAGKGPHEQTVLRAVGEVLGRDGDGLGVKQLIDRCLEETPFDEGSGKRDRRRDGLNQALDRLVEDGRLRISGGKVLLSETE